MTSFAKGEYPASKTAIERFLDMLSYKRPSGSDTEVDFLNAHVVPLGVTWDKYGNGIKKIGDSPVAWSCHTDTVHRNEGRQLVVHEGNTVKLAKKSSSNCLGADDTSGLWLMSEMIKAKRPGLYIFHRAEECGGFGSKWLSKNTPELVKGIECMIALDRKANNSIITHQWGGRCCSDEFGLSFAKKLELDMKLDTGGSFTDSASYTDLIGECTNLSVGYKWQHSSTEEQDLMFLCKLRERLIEIDCRDLTFKRKPGEVEPRPAYNYGGGYQYNPDDYADGHYYPTYNRGGRGSNNKGNSLANSAYTRYTEERKGLPPTHVRSINYCPVTFQGFFWRDDHYVKCSKEAWVDRCKELKIYEFKAPIVTIIHGGKKDEPKTSVPSTVVKNDGTKEETDKPSLLPERKYFCRQEGGKIVPLSLIDLVYAHPGAVSKILDDWGFDVPSLHAMIKDKVAQVNAENPTSTIRLSDPVDMVLPN